MLDQSQRSPPKAEFMNQLNESNQTSHEAKNESEVIFYKLIHEIAFETFHVSDAFVASVVFVAISLISKASASTSEISVASASNLIISMTSVSKISVQTSYENENESKLISSNDLVSTKIISLANFIANDAASTAIISTAMFSANDFVSAMTISLFNFMTAIIANGSACNQSTTDSFSFIDAPFSSYESNHSHSYASDRFFFSCTQFHQTLNRLAYQELNCFKKVKINSINSTFDQLRRLFRLHHHSYVRRSSNGIQNFIFSLFFQNFNQ